MRKPLIALLLLCTLTLTACSSPPDGNPIVTIVMDDDSEIVIELYPDKAPNTVANFVSLIEQGFYDGLDFYRLAPITTDKKVSIIQSGSPDGTLTGNPGYTIHGEFSQNGFTQNDLKHKRGVISMAHATSPDSAGSQFFITTETVPSLDDKYAVFGEVKKGMSVVDNIASAERDGQTPLNPRGIKKVTVDTKGKEYKVESTPIYK